MPVAGLVSGLLVLSVGLGAERFFRPPPDPVREIIAGAERIESFAVAPGLGPGPAPEGEETVAGHRVLATGRSAKGRRVKRIGAMLLDEESYRVGAAGDSKTCEFLPRHALRFVRGDRSTDVLFCFSCAQLLFEGGSGDFDPVARELEARVRSLVEKKESGEEREREAGRETGKRREAMEAPDRHPSGDGQK